jgi:hypothetical protein
MPFKLYELTRYSFRREKSGELVGLRRLRAFTMPDCHAFCKDMQQAKEEFRKRFELSISVINALGLSNDDVEMAIRFTKEFWNENKDFITELIDRLGKPALAEVWDERFFYFTLKWEFNYIDGLAKASALSTDQIDVEVCRRGRHEKEPNNIAQLAFRRNRTGDVCPDGKGRENLKDWWHAVVPALACAHASAHHFCRQRTPAILRRPVRSADGKPDPSRH